MSVYPRTVTRDYLWPLKRDVFQKDKFRSGSALAVDGENGQGWIYFGGAEFGRHGFDLEHH